MDELELRIRERFSLLDVRLIDGTHNQQPVGITEWFNWAEAIEENDEKLQRIKKEHQNERSRKLLFTNLDLPSVDQLSLTQSVETSRDHHRVAKMKLSLILCICSQFGSIEYVKLSPGDQEKSAFCFVIFKNMVQALSCYRGLKKDSLKKAHCEEINRFLHDLRNSIEVTSTIDAEQPEIASDPVLLINQLISILCISDDFRCEIPKKSPLLQVYQRRPHKKRCSLSEKKGTPN